MYEILNIHIQLFKDLCVRTLRTKQSVEDFMAYPILTIRLEREPERMLWMHRKLYFPRRFHFKQMLETILLMEVVDPLHNIQLLAQFRLCIVCQSLEPDPRMAHRCIDYSKSFPLKPMRSVGSRHCRDDGDLTVKNRDGVVSFYYRQNLGTLRATRIKTWFPSDNFRFRTKVSKTCL